MQALSAATRTPFSIATRATSRQALTCVSATSGGTAITGGVGKPPPEAPIPLTGAMWFYESSGQFSSADTNTVQDVFRKDLQTGELVRISSLDGKPWRQRLLGDVCGSRRRPDDCFGTGANDLFGSTPTFTQTLLGSRAVRCRSSSPGLPGVDIVQASEISDSVSAGTGNDTLFLRGGGNDTADAGPGKRPDRRGAGPETRLRAEVATTGRFTASRPARSRSPPTSAARRRSQALASPDTLSGVEVAQSPTARSSRCRSAPTRRSLG